MSLNKRIISSLIGDLSADLPIIVYKTIGSTNTEAKAAANEGKFKKAVFLASEQTAGRGRLGRSFVSNSGKGLYLTILLGEEMPADFATSLTTYMATVAARAIEALADVRVDIKWVNDLYVGGKKLSGILTEGKASGKGSYLSYAAVGIGINLLEQKFPDDVKEIATTLERECGTKIDVNELAALIIKQFFDNLSLVGTKQIAEEYKNRSFLIGKCVTVVKPTVEYEATVEDITDRCELVLTLKDGSSEILSTGEISNRIRVK